jgi:hypothetical protein
MNTHTRIPTNSSIRKLDVDANASVSVAGAPNLRIESEFLDFAERHGLALIEVHAGRKAPVGDDWQFRSSKDRATWERWLSSGSNVGIHAGASDLATADVEAGRWALFAAWCVEIGIEEPVPQIGSARDGRHVLFRLPTSFKLKKKKFAWGELIVGNNQTVAPPSYFDKTSEGKQSGWYRFLDLSGPYDGSPLLKLWERKEREPRTVAPALNGYSYDEVAWWIDQKIERAWKDVPSSPWNDQGEWIFFGKSLKLHFPGMDGLDLFLRATWDGREKAESRWWDENDFKTEWFDGARTLKSYLDRDITWMFRGIPALGCPMAPRPVVHYDVPAEVLEQYKQAREERATAAPAADDLAWLAPKPFVWKDPKTLPRMQWLYGRTLLRGAVYMTVAAPGVAKTARKLVDALAMVSGRVLLHDKPARALKVWHLNGEEPIDILEKRVIAAMMAHSIPREDVDGRLFLNDLASRFIIARQTKEGVVIMVPVRDAMINYIRANQIDVVQIDPFISSHAVPENDNGPIDQVVKTFAGIAMATGCAIDLVHHARKTNGQPVTFEDARGASAAGGAVRGGDVQNVMTKEVATLAGIEERFRKRYVRIDDGKANHAPQGDTAKWLKIEGVDLGNGDFFNPGDSMPVVKAWHWPDHAADIAPEDLTKVQEAVAAGTWRQNVQAKDWVGKAIAGALDLDLDNKADTAKVKGLIKRWLADGHLVVVTGLDEKRNERSFIEVGKVRQKSPGYKTHTTT